MSPSFSASRVSSNRTGARACSEPSYRRWPSLAVVGRRSSWPVMAFVALPRCPAALPFWVWSRSGCFPLLLHGKTCSKDIRDRVLSGTEIHIHIRITIMVLTSSLTTVLLALAVAGEPIVMKRTPVLMPITKRLNSDRLRLAEQDQRRAHALMSRSAAKAAGKVTTRQANSDATNTGISYVASIGVGSPPRYYSVIVDTGSSNTWVGANPNNPYVKTSTSIPTNQSVGVEYGNASIFSGSEFLDTVTIASDLVINNQSIGAASKAMNFTGIDGIIGIGPVDLTLDTLSPNTTEEIPTVTDNLFSANIIPEHLVSISFAPITADDTVNGELTWGGTDSTKFTGSITYTGITTTSPASRYWGVDASFSYGTGNILSTTAGIVDSRTTLILLASEAFSQYQAATGAKWDPDTGLLRINKTQYNNLSTLDLLFNGTTFKLTSNAQIWPRSIPLKGADADSIYLIVGSTKMNSGSGLDFVLGQTFLERFYAVFDTGNKRVGLATTPFTNATTN